MRRDLLPAPAVTAAARLSTTGRENDPEYRARMEDILTAACPFLASDRAAVEHAARALAVEAGEEHVFGDCGGASDVIAATAYRMSASRALNAALNP